MKSDTRSCERIAGTVATSSRTGNYRGNDRDTGVGSTVTIQGLRTTENNKK